MRKGIPAFIFLFWSINTIAQSTNLPPVYPRVVGYFSVVHPLFTADKNETVYNFSSSYTIGFPMGINILKSDRIGFSLEIAPFIKSAEGSSKTSNVLFHPGLMFRRAHNFTIITRAAFETSGRYGATIVFNKLFLRTKMNSYWIAVPVPARFGNDKPASIGMGFQLGVSF